jgi:hypothetical protein
VNHLWIVGNVGLPPKGPEDARPWPEPPGDFVDQLAEEIREYRRPAEETGGRFGYALAVVGATALLLPFAAFADQAGDNLARRDDAVDVELVATDDDDGGGGGDSDSETSAVGAYDVGGDSDSESSGHVGEYDVGGGDDSEDSDSESDDGGGGAPQPPALPGGGDDDDSTDDGGQQLEPQPQPPAPLVDGGGDDDDSDSGD